MSGDPFGVIRTFETSEGMGRFYSLPALVEGDVGNVYRLPASLRVMLESLLRNCDGKRITQEHVRKLAAWRPNAERTSEVPFVAARILLQDMSGLPTLNDFAMLRATAQRLSVDPSRVEPLVPVDLVIDHSVEVDVARTPDALRRNMENEFRRNIERYQFIKWGMHAFSNIRVIPPGNGICHQVNLEYLARLVFEKDGIYYPDTLVGTDSHTTMINGLGVVGWGVGGIEAEAGMLGQPIYLLTPDVVGVHLTGTLQPGVTATDLVLSMTERLRQTRVVGKIVEYFGEGAAALSVADRSVLANMAPDYGATMGYFAVDEKSLAYLRDTGRPEPLVRTVESYYRAQGLFGIPRAGDCDYTEVVEFDLGSVHPSVAGPKRPQDRIDLGDLKQHFRDLFTRTAEQGGYGRNADDFDHRFPAGNVSTVSHGDILIAAITSCANTSNPALMVGAGLLARKAVQRGLRVDGKIKTSFAPGSKVVTAYLRDAGLLADMEALGFSVVAYGCTTCAGASGPLDPVIESAVRKGELVGCAVLSGNRNFEARIHQAVRANFLMSPALVIAFALAGTVNRDLTTEPIANGSDGRPVYLRDIWPSEAEIEAALRYTRNIGHFRSEYANLDSELWRGIPEARGLVFDWQDTSTYIKQPPFMDDFALGVGSISDITGARALALLGDSITTDHISSVAPIAPESPAGRWLQEHGEERGKYGNFGVRRLNHEVMVRGTFTNVRLKNLMAPGTEGGITVHQPSGDVTGIFEAATRYRQDGVPLFLFGGADYGTGSARDWAAKGTQLLGVRAVIARSFERIHRANLVGMGVLPCQFPEGLSWQDLGIDGSETFDLRGIAGELRPMQDATLVVHRANGKTDTVPLRLRIDTPIEAEYLRHGGILPYMLREIVAAAA